MHPAPATAEPCEQCAILRETTLRPLSEALNPGYWAERAIGVPALDVNAFGQVPDSPWFENRLGRADLTPDAIARGPNQEGPAPGPLVVLGGKLEGATPGLIVEDARGDRYVVKFDPPAFPNLASGAEAIATRLLWAAGYHVPENYVVRFDLKRLALSPRAITGGRYGRTVPLTRQRLIDLIALVNPFPDGTIRALFSKVIPGQPVGPFSYRGLRADDPNDVIPTSGGAACGGCGSSRRGSTTWTPGTPTPTTCSCRRRATPAAVTSSTYLLDFGDALGSAGTGPKYLGEGYEGLLDWQQILQSFFSAGLWYRYWLRSSARPMARWGSTRPRSSSRPGGAPRSRTPPSIRRSPWTPTGPPPSSPASTWTIWWRW